MLTIFPALCFFITGTTALQQRKGPVRFTLITLLEELERSSPRSCV